MAATTTTTLEDLLNFPAPHVHDRIFALMDLESKRGMLSVSRTARRFVQARVGTPGFAVPERRRNLRRVRELYEISLDTVMSDAFNDTAVAVDDDSGDVFLVSSATNSVRLYRNFRLAGQVGLSEAEERDAHRYLVWGSGARLFVLRPADDGRSPEHPMLRVATTSWHLAHIGRDGGELTLEKEEVVSFEEELSFADSLHVLDVLKDPATEHDPVPYVKRNLGGEEGGDPAPAMKRLIRLARSAYMRQFFCGSASNERLTVSVPDCVEGLINVLVRRIEDDELLWVKNVEFPTEGMLNPRLDIPPAMKLSLCDQRLLVLGQNGKWIVVDLGDGSGGGGGGGGEVLARGVVDGPFYQTSVVPLGREEGWFAICSGVEDDNDSGGGGGGRYLQVDIVGAGGTRRVRAREDNLNYYSMRYLREEGLLVWRGD